MKTDYLRGRPDELDWAILDYVSSRPRGSTIRDINDAVCPGERTGFVRYRVATLHDAGLLREARMFGRVVVFSIDRARRLRAGATDA